jgi:hypothetical protein
VLKKVGIVAAAATASMIALSPLAFAQGNGDRDRDGDRLDYSNSTAFSFEDNSVERNQRNACEFDQDAIVVPPVAGVAPGSVTQSANGNCINIGDGGEFTAPEAPLDIPAGLLGILG